MSELGLAYKQFNADEQYAYRIILEALQKQASSCDISHVKRNVKLMEILVAVLGDNPDIIYFNKTMIRTMGGFFGKQLSFVGCMNRKEAEQCSLKLKKALEDAVWAIDKKARDDREILQGISEYLQENVVYDTDELNSAMRGRSKSPVSHNAYGALVNHKAVCDGFSCAYALIAQYFGFHVMVVEGKSSYQRSSKIDHAWNIVEYQGQYYHIDSTWDANTYAVAKTYSYNYFGSDDDEISVDHEWDFRRTPPCKANKLSYFMSQKKYAQSGSHIEDIICRAMKANERTVSLKISPAVPIKDNSESDITDIMQNAASRAGWCREYHYFWNAETRCLIVNL